MMMMLQSALFDILGLMPTKLMDMSVKQLSLYRFMMS